MFRIIFVLLAGIIAGCGATPVERTSQTDFKPRVVQETRECDPPAGWDKAAAWAKGAKGAHTAYERRNARVEYTTRGSSYSGLSCEFRIEAGSSSEVRRERKW